MNQGPVGAARRRAGWWRLRRQGLALLILLSACTTRTHTPRNLAAWGRAGRVGATSRSQPVALHVTPDGERVTLAYPARAAGEDVDHIHVLALNHKGEVVDDRALEPPIAHLQEVQLVVDAGGQRYLVWRAGLHQAQRLWYAPLPAPDTPLLLQAQPASPDDVQVTWYRAYGLPGGGVWVAWQSTHREAYGTQLTGGNNTRAFLGNVTVMDVEVDDRGLAHVAWSTREAVTRLDLYYARLDPETLTLSEPLLVGSEALPGQTSPNVVDGPTLGVSGSNIYVSWTRRDVSQGGVERLSTRVLPQDDTPTLTPMPGEPHLLQVTAGYPPPVEAVPSITTGKYGPLMSSEFPGHVPAHARHAPAALHTNGETMVLALPVSYNTRTRQAYQPTLVYWQGGTYIGYQALTWTEPPSMYPAIVADAADHLYVAWIESSGESFHYNIYLASTAPLRTAWQRLTLADYATIAVDLGSRIASGVVLLPLIALWFFLPFIWLFVKLASGAEHGRRGKRVLIGALWLYWASKYLLTRQLLGYVPGLQRLSPDFSALLIYLVPILTLIVSLMLQGGIFWLRRGRTFSAMRSYLTLALLDCALSMSVYAIGYFE